MAEGITEPFGPDGEDGGDSDGEAAFAPLSAPAPEPIQLSARMLNEFVYCPRLFFYEYVEGIFVENADTLRGAHLHRRVDSGTGKMPPATATNNTTSTGTDAADAAADSAEIPSDFASNAADQAAAMAGGDPLAAGGADGTTAAAADTADEEDPAAAAELAAARERGDLIHSRSVWLSSARLDLNAKLDLVETREATTADGRRATTPVDYKKGAPREGEDANEIWDADRMQLGLQMLILRENGYDCTEGVIFYQQTRQRVRLPWTADLAAWIERTATQARALAAGGTIPPPLFHSPKCVRCSLNVVCLPDETTMLTASAGEPAAATLDPDPDPGQEQPDGAAARQPRPGILPVVPPRALMASRDERRALYLNTPGLWVGLKSERLVVKDKEKIIDDVRLRDVNHLALFGNIQLSTQAIQQLCSLEIPVTYFSMGGWFYGMTRGHGMKNVHTRIEQFRCAGDPAGSLALAKQFVHGKIRNQRTMLMRNHIELPDWPSLRLKQASLDVWRARSLGELMGMEGAAARVYFTYFGGMIKVNADGTGRPGRQPRPAGGGRSGPAAGNAPAAENDPAAGSKEAGWCSFDFNGRNRRPPRDPVNALLSLAYSLLAKDCALAALAVGFDPYVGFFHQPRAGRPALALDLQEEFRPLIADSAVLNALNTRVITAGDFLRAGESVSLTKTGRKHFFDCYERRMNENLRHPVFNYQVSYRRALELQARLLAKTLTGEIPEYRALTTR